VHDVLDAGRVGAHALEVDHPSFEVEGGNRRKSGSPS
jgi:hypothetical protein